MDLGGLTDIARESNIARLYDANGSVNSKVALTVTSRAAENQVSPYGPSFSSKMDSARAIQERANSIGSGVITVADISLATDGSTWQPYQLFDADTFSTDGAQDRAVPVGYVIEKYREDSNGLIKNFDRIFIEGINNTTYIDPAVATNHRYFYTIRTVFLTEFNAINIADAEGENEGQTAIARVLIASRGSPLIKVDTIDEIAPAPPDTLKFSYDPRRGGLLIFWEYPPDAGALDIGSWQIFKRKTLNEPYTLIGQLMWDGFSNRYEVVPEKYITRTNGPQNFFVDQEFSTFSRAYYAVCAIDHSAFTSGYSTQYYVNYDYVNQRTNARKVSRRDAPKPYPNFYIEEEPVELQKENRLATKIETTKTELFVDTMKDSGHQRLRVFLDPEYYKVLDYRDPSSPGERATEPLEINLLEQHASEPRYKLTFINVDLQESQILDIVVRPSL